MKYILLLLLSVLSVIAQDIDLTGYTLTFEDNFDTLSLGPVANKGNATWADRPPYGGSGNFSQSEWSSDSTTLHVFNGVLVNTAWYAGTATSTGYRSGFVSSMDSRKQGFSQRFGYFSARVKLPDGGTGTWPAFWLQGSNSIPNNTGQRLEIDILEHYGYQHFQWHSVGHSVHNWNGDGSQGPGTKGTWGEIPGRTPFDWHVYGCDWRPDKTRFYIDGILTAEIDTNLDYCNFPVFAMVNYALGGGWPVSGPPYNTRGSAEMLVDWVRVYSLPSNVTIPPVDTATINNPSFEKDVAGAQQVIGWGEWSSANANYAGSVRSGDSHSGANHYRMEGTNFNLLLSQVVQVQEAGVYTFRAWAKSSGGSAQILLQDYAGPNRSQHVPVTDAWTQVEIKDIKMSTGSSIRLGMWATTGWAAFDDIEFSNQRVSSPENLRVSK